MRWFDAALAARGSPGGGRGGGSAPPCSRLRSASAAAGAAPARRPSARTGVFTGYGFESCNAPTTEALTAWLASPYRAVGIYIGGVNRTCANAELTSTWVAAALARRLEPDPDLRRPAGAVRRRTRERARFTAANAQSQGLAAADDAIARAHADRPPGGQPDLLRHGGLRAQGRRVHAGGADVRLGLGRPSCTRAATSPASTAAPPRPRATCRRSPARRRARTTSGSRTGTASESVFGDPYVSDALWTNHQRIHQYRGGHKETWGGVTINIDNDYVDGAVVSPTATVRRPPPAAGRARLGEHATTGWRARPGPPARSTKTPTSARPTPCPA